MGAPTKIPTGVIKGRLVSNPEIKIRRLNKGNKLRPFHSVLEIHEKEGLQRVRIAPKATILDPPQQNLMYDYRIHRGSPYINSRLEPLPQPRKLKRKKDGVLCSRTLTPKPIKLDYYLEALPKPNHEDPDPPPPKRPIPPFAPWPILPEKETQIWLGDLVWFDDDVEPMLEQLVGRCLEQGYMECQEGQTIEAQRAQQENFEFIKIGELDTWQRMHLAEIRIAEERESRKEQEQVAEKLEMLLKIKVELQTIANGILKSLKTKVLESLEAKRMFYDPLEEELTLLFLPGFMKDMIKEYNEIIKFRQIMNLLVDETVECPTYIEKAEGGMEIILAKLISILDSWISFEDSVMMEIDAVELASQRIMEGSVAEVGLVTDTSGTILSGIIKTTSEASGVAHRIVEDISGQFREDELYKSILDQFPDEANSDKGYYTKIGK